MEKVISFDGGGICPICSSLQDDLSQHLTYHSKDDIIKALSSSHLLSNVLSGSQIGQIAAPELESENDTPSTLGLPCDNPSISASLPVNSTPMTPVMSFPSVVSNNSSPLCNVATPPANGFATLQLCPVRTPYSMTPQIQNMQGPNILCKQPVLNPAQNSQVFVSNPIAFPTYKSGPPVLQNVAEQDPLGNLPEHDSSMEAPCESDVILSPQKPGTSQGVPNRLVNINQGGFPFPNTQPQMLYVLPTVPPPTFFPNNYLSYNNPGVAFPNPFQQVVQVPANGMSNLQGDGRFVLSSPLQGLSHSPGGSNSIQHLFADQNGQIVGVSQPNGLHPCLKGPFPNGAYPAENAKGQVLTSTSKANNKSESVISLGKNIKISVPSELASKKEKLKQLINRELVHALLLNDSDKEDEIEMTHKSEPTTCDQNVGTEETSPVAESEVDDLADNTSSQQSLELFAEAGAEQLGAKPDASPCKKMKAPHSLESPPSQPSGGNLSAELNSALLGGHKLEQVLLLEDEDKLCINYLFPKAQVGAKIKASCSSEESHASSAAQKRNIPEETSDKKELLFEEYEHSVSPPLDEFICKQDEEVYEVQNGDPSLEVESGGDIFVIESTSSENALAHVNESDSRTTPTPEDRHNTVGSSNFHFFDSSNLYRTYSKPARFKKASGSAEGVCLPFDKDVSLKDNMQIQSIIDISKEYLQNSDQINVFVDKENQPKEVGDPEDEGSEGPLPHYSKDSTMHPICLFKMENVDSMSAQQEEIMSLKASETLEESDQELSMSCEDIQNFDIDKSAEDVTSTFCSTSGGALAPETSVYFKAASPLGSLNMTLDGNCSILPCDPLMLPNMMSHLDSTPDETPPQMEDLDDKAKVTAKEKAEVQFPLASTSGLQKSSSFSFKRNSEEEDYDFDYESDYFDSDSDACFGQRHALDIDKWRCTRCNKTFKSLKEKLLHAGHHSPCSNDGSAPSQKSLSGSTAGLKKEGSLGSGEATGDRGESAKPETNKFTCERILKMEDVISRDFVESALASLKTIDGKCKCLECPMVFSTLEEVHQHRVSVFRSQTACGLCHKDFESRNAKVAHLKSHSLSDRKCHTCHRTFASHSTWCQHQLFHMGLLYHGCRECGRTFQTKGELVLHRRKHTGEKPFKCKTCKRSFSANQALKRHLLTHMEGQEVECDVCRKKFKNALSLGKHKFKLHPKKRKILRKRTDYMCHVCNEVFLSERKLSWHQETHERWPKKCQQCGECYVHQANLTKHIRLKHDPTHIPKGEKEVNCTKCPICSRIYTRSSLAMHMLTHNGVKPYKCNVCNKQFSVKCNYLTHKWVHMGPRDRPFKCKMCERSFHRQRFLEAHVRSHKNIRPYTCNECGKSFIHKNNLETHIKQHSGIKEHACPDCGKAFFRKYNLNNHIRIHTGESPYKCAICQKEFTQKSNYNVHMKAFHIERHAVHEEV